MKIVYKKPSELKAADYNPRQLSEIQFLQLKKSLEGFDVVEPIVINTFKGRENIIVGGHQRVKVLESMGVKTIPCVEVSLPIEKEKELNVRLNKNTGQFDFDMLANNFEIDDLLEWGFTEDELSFSTEVVEGLTDEDAVPAAPEIPKTVLGDVWVLGNHRLMCGDSTSIDAVEKLCNGNAVDMLLTDPPYNVAYEGKTKEALKIQNDQMGDDSFLQFLTDAFIPAASVMKAGAVFYIWHADSEGYNFRGACKAAGFTVRQCLIWVKQTMVMGRQDYHWKHEPCLYGWKDGAGHLWASDRKQTTVLEFNRPSRNAEHPTMKPVELFEYQLLNNTKGGDIVLDVFAGSGTTAIAAEKNGRKAYLMELDPKYCDVIIQRWQEFTGKKAIHAETGEPFNGDTK